MIYKLIIDENGNFIKDNIKYTILEATSYIDTSEGRNIDCYEFIDISQAISFFGLIEIK